MNKKIKNGMNKKGKRIINRETCALYAEQIYKELMNHFSSMQIEVKFRKTSVERLSLKEDPKRLEFSIDGINYVVNICAYAGHMLLEPFQYLCSMLRRRMVYTWRLSVCHRFSAPHDVLEMVMLAYYLHQKYNTYETIEEMKELALQNNVPYECVSVEHEDTGELIKRFVNKHNIEDDRFGMTYYFIQYLCIEALSILDDDDWDEDD